jgi:hypothetical protein
MVPAIIAIALVVAIVALNWAADDEEERREGGADPGPWSRQAFRVGVSAALVVGGMVFWVLFFLVLGGGGYVGKTAGSTRATSRRRSAPLNRARPPRTETLSSRGFRPARARPAFPRRGPVASRAP